MLFILIVISFTISLLLSKYLSKSGNLFYFVAECNTRSLHTKPTSASGGIAIFISFSITIVISSFFYEIPHNMNWFAGLLIVFISILDDWRPISALYRLIVHFIAAFLLLHYSDLWLNFVILPNFLVIPVSLLLVVWLINLYNFMDGMDGFAGGMAIFGFGSLAIFGYLSGHIYFLVINLIIVSSVAGFLWFNFPPAKIFMGDTGSSLLGFLAIGLSLWADKYEILPLWLAVLIFSPFVIDASVTLLKRLFNKEKIWVAHKTHYYQKLVQLGWGHKKTVIFEYILMAMCCITALFINYLNFYWQWFFIAIWLFIYLFLIHKINHYVKK
jgi:UDP-N-acetylmuramyl pentapeptide phosphotransferase/UDP-N-acetylglucosamine-1-phosphate transferase